MRQKLLGIMAIFVAVMLALAFIACKDDPEPAHVHDYEWSVTTPATCIATGEETGVCKLDSSHTATREIAIDADAHDWGEWEGTVTCETAGTGTRVCSRSESHIETNNNLQPLGHNYKYETTTDPTCTTAGVATGTCTHDESHTTARVVAIDPTAHNWQLSPTATAPTCTVDGNGDQICSYNEAHTQSGIIPKLGHDWVAGPDAHTLPTCTTVGYGTEVCTRCPETKPEGEIPALGHNYQNWTTTTAPTCTTAGVETGTCTHDNAHTTTRLKAIDPNAHDWNTTYTTITAATETTDGIEAITCEHNATHTKDPHTLWATGTEGLDFTLISINGGSNNAYRVSNKDDSNGTAIGAIHIPAYYRPDASSGYLSVTAIGNATDDGGSSAFGGTYSSYNTTVTSVTFAAGSQLTSINGYAFYRCQNLTNITIPEGVTSIGNNVFGGCTSLTNITIPASVTTIGSMAFDGCGSLSSVTFAADSRLETINGAAFQSCTSLTSITIPASVTSISGSVFFGVSSLTAITVDQNNSNYASEGGILYNKAKTTLIRAPNGIRGNVTIPATVTSIESQGFHRCRNLSSVTIPASVISIGSSSFYEWYSAQTIYIEGYASLTEANNAWGTGWRNSCDATIKYWNGSSYQ